MQTVKAKMKRSIINCISLGSILRVKIKRSSEKRIHFVFLSPFEKLQPDTLDMYNGLSQVHSIKPEGNIHQYTKDYISPGSITSLNRTR